MGDGACDVGFFKPKIMQKNLHVIDVLIPIGNYFTSIENRR